MDLKKATRQMFKLKSKHKNITESFTFEYEQCGHS